ncbi:MAG: YihA family ribosome biogenesis GTP-binding protein [Bacteroidetes bacterium 4572_117]|nr:MAG: YihA family ribosome biogenesis GTP-binding protein [Bacteroidetes bacterium 4572_117]
MIIKTSKFVVSNTEIKKCPSPTIPEYAFIGRSNVGKSSLINMLTKRKNLAKISGQPGKTRLINHFIVNDNWYLVDLPGYGYAKISKTQRNIWHGFIKEYLTKRENLICTFVLIDARHKAQKNDLDFMMEMALKSIPFAIVFTKSDKISKGQLAANILDYKKTMLKEWEVFPVYFETSAVKSKGREEILDYIEKLNFSPVAEKIKARVY